MPESSKTMLMWDGSQKNFAKFKDKVFERFSMDTEEESHNNSGT
jgi:hypothetical protein